MREFIATLLRPFRGAGAWLVDAGKYVMQGLLRGIRSPIATIKKVVGGLRSTFSGVVDGIRSVWNGIENIMAAPISWVIDNVINKLFAAMSELPGVEIKPIKPIGSAGKETGSDRAAAAHGGKGGRGGRNFGGKGGKRTWPANTRALSGNYAGHSGIDIAAANGSPIRAASGGRVEYTGWGRGYGQAIMVREIVGAGVVTLATAIPVLTR